MSYRASVHKENTLQHAQNGQINTLPVTQKVLKHSVDQNIFLKSISFLLRK